jgi:6,7-dimethyl-8-ribityllumazine synthase
MSGEGNAPRPAYDGSGLRVAVVATQWHTEITDSLLREALVELDRCKVAAPTIVRVPGAFELPLAAQKLAATHDAVVCLGLVLRGGTPHFDFVCNAATDGLTRVALDTGVPVGFGLLTCDSEEQARARSGLPGSQESKGAEAASAAVATALALQDL